MATGQSNMQWPILKIEEDECYNMYMLSPQFTCPPSYNMLKSSSHVLVFYMATDRNTSEDVNTIIISIII